MSKFKVLQPISYFGERRERGTIVELTEEEASAFGEDYLAPASESETTDDIKVEEEVAVKPKRGRKSKK